MELLDRYIASGFFNPEQLEKVKSVEKELDESGLTYFSPRSFVMDLSPSNPDREKNAKILFDKDIEMIEKVKKMHIILDESLDIGTLFELGYSIGKILMGEVPRDFIHLDISDEDTRELIDYTIEGLLNEELTNLLTTEESEWEYIVPASLEDEFNSTVDTFSMNIDWMVMGDNLHSNFSELIQDGNTPIFITDDHPKESFILMGLLRKLGIKFYTASLNNYGSNIMIASSSEGHITLPKMTNPYSTNTKIE